MSRTNKIKSGTAPFYSFALAWIISSFIFPPYRVWGLLATAGVSAVTALIVYAVSNRKSGKAPVQTAPKVVKNTVAEAKPETKSYGPQVDPILEEGRKALSEMGRLYSAIGNPEVKEKINEIMRITDKITQDAIDDPSDIPQIKKFLNYYLPTTIKLLNAYDRMSDQGISGENLDKSMKNITDMLDEAILAFQKRLDSLFANQALDIETDIKVMNTMLAREGLAGEKDFEVQEQKGQSL